MLKRIGAGYFTIAYRNQENNIILFSVDKTKDVMCELSGTSEHFPFIEKLTTVTLPSNFGTMVDVGIYKTELLIPLSNIKYKNKPWLNRGDCDYEKLMSYMPPIRKQKTVYETFWLWYSGLKNNEELSHYAQILATQFEYFYDAFGEEITLDFGRQNVSVRLEQSQLVFHDTYAIHSNFSNGRIIYWFNRKLITETYIDLVKNDPNFALAVSAYTHNGYIQQQFKELFTGELENA